MVVVKRLKRHALKILYYTIPNIKKLMAHRTGNDIWQYVNAQQYYIISTEAFLLNALYSLKENIECKRKCKNVKYTELISLWKLALIEKNKLFNTLTKNENMHTPT